MGFFLCKGSEFYKLFFWNSYVTIARVFKKAKDIPYSLLPEVLINNKNYEKEVKKWFKNLMKLVKNIEKKQLLEINYYSFREYSVTSGWVCIHYVW